MSNTWEERKTNAALQEIPRQLKRIADSLEYFVQVDKDDRTAADEALEQL